MWLMHDDEIASFLAMTKFVMLMHGYEIASFPAMTKFVMLNNGIVQKPPEFDTWKARKCELSELWLFLT